MYEYSQLANLRYELEDGCGEERANGQSDEKVQRIFHAIRLHQRYDGNSGERAGIDHGHTQKRKTPHCMWNKEEH